MSAGINAQEMQYLEQFAILAKESYGPNDWSRVEEVFRAVWPQTGYGLAFEKALAVIRERFGAAG